MAPVQFQPHACDHCRGLVVEADHSATNNANRVQSDMGWDKIHFNMTFRELKSAAAEACSLCRWILDGEAVSRPEIGDEDFEKYGSAVRLLMAGYDDDPESTHGSLLHAVRDRGAEVDEYLVVAATNPPFRNGMSFTPNILCIQYFGLLDPQSMLMRYRTRKGLQLFAPAGDVSARQLSTRPVENQPARCLAEISSWLRDCSLHHAKCRETTDAWRQFMGSGMQPKRLIQLQHDLGTGLRSMRLQDTEALHPLPPFAALSYCWGGDQPVKCLVSTLASLTTSISFEDLPKTIQDAILVCERLACGYLWVDALCIVQDRDEEKTVEIAKMPYIYGNSLFTITATRAASVWEGFLGDRITSPDAIPAFSMGWVQAAPGGGKEEGALTLIDLPIPFEPIDSRGWTLQERALSTRTIEFGSRQTRWTCQERTSSDMSTMGAADGWRAEPEANRASFDPRDWFLIDEDPYGSWAEIIRHFSQRQLTLSTDRPLAISGIAERFSRLTGDRYMAGLWASHLHAGLLWTVDARHRTARPASYQGPSWSWLAVNSEVRPYLPHFRERFGAEILSASAEPANHMAPFGATRECSGRLRVRARLAPATYHRADDPMGEAGVDGLGQSHDHEITVSDDGDGDGRARTARLYLDCAEDALGGAAAGDTVMVVELQSVRLGSDCSSEGLLLRRASGEDGLPQTCDDNVPVYVRLGVYEFETEVSEIQGDDDGWDPRWEDEGEDFSLLEGGELSTIEIW
jgi:hypothetical protein